MTKLALEDSLINYKRGHLSLEAILVIVENYSSASNNGKPHVIRRFFDEMSKKYNVDIDSLNVHITNGQIYVQKYTPGHVDMFKLLEIVE